MRQGKRSVKGWQKFDCRIQPLKEAPQDEATFSHKHHIALGVGLSLIVLSVATSYITINFPVRAAQQETQTQETFILLERLVSQFKTAESLQRRYLLTATEPDLAAYQKARERIEQALPRVQSAPTLTDRNQDLRTLQTLMGRRMELMEQAVAVRQQVGLEAATLILGSELNRQLHEEIDGVVNRIRSGETLTLESLKEETRQTAQNVKLLILLGGLLSLSVLAWAILMIVRSQANQRCIEAKLSDTVPALIAYLDKNQRFQFHNKAYGRKHRFRDGDECRYDFLFRAA